MSELDDRRQRAREAYWDTSDDDCLEAAIETATRVRIDESVIASARAESPDGFIAVRALIAAFRAAGFEVEP